MKYAFAKVLSFAVVAMVGLSASAATYTIEAGDVADLFTKTLAAGNGDTIILKPGLYDLSTLPPISPKEAVGGSVTDLRTAHLIINNKNITFRGENTKHWSEKTPEEETILRGNNTARLIYPYAGNGRDSKFLHVTFENGNASTSPTDTYGGAIYFNGNSWGYATNCIFRNCKATNGGGTFCVTSYDCLYENCSATTQGGGSYGNGSADYKAPTNRYAVCVFSGCSASQGGGLYANQMHMLGNREKGGYVEGCVFTNNTATSGGGALYVSAGKVGSPAGMDFLNDCSFVDNKVTAGDGGAIYGSKLESITNCSFKDNTSSSAGGAVYLGDDSENVPLEGCSFIGNTATSGHGGAVCAKKSITVVTNCTFVCNKAGNHGGAISTETNIGSLADSTFVSNVAAAAGGAIRALGTVTSADRCTFSDNAATSGAGGVNMAVTSGIFTDCVFHSNTNNETTTFYGAHTPRALKMVRCQFSGYGDVCARDYDSCIFSNCFYRYTEPSYGSDGHGLITYPYAIGNGSIRNCLVRDCHVSRIIASAGVTVDIENCTFADNRVEMPKGTGGGEIAIMFFAFRNDSGTAAVSTNRFVNCIFADNWQSGKNKIDAYFQGTSKSIGGVTCYAHTLVSNCIYRTNTDQKNGTYKEFDFNKGDPKFVKDNAKFVGKYPDYMICRDSAAADKGVPLPWHADGKDLLGNPRTHGTAVDIGAYESILPVAYVGEVDYETLEEAIAAVGITKRIGLYGDARLDNWEQVAAERYFLEPNGHTVTAPSGADVQCVNDTLSVKVRGIYEPAGDFNIMPGSIAELTNAIKKANNSDVIVLSPGTYDLSELQEYREPASGTASWGTAVAVDGYEKSSLVVNKGLTYKGAYAGSWREQTNDDGLQTTRTILKGSGDMRIFYGYTGTGRGSKFCHLTFENGKTSGANGLGGAICYLGNSNGFATNCVFRNCSATKGGGTYCVTSYDCLYENCSADSASESGTGGGACGNGASSYNAATNRYAACVFSGCSAYQGGGLYAGEMRMLGNRKTGGYIEGCVFTNNTAVNNGGAIYGNKVDTLTDCHFVDNHSNLGEGGALFLSTACNGIASNCTFVGNSSRGGGAVGKCDYIYDSVFTDNWSTNNGVTKAHGGGGAIANALGMFDCTFSNNIAYVISGATVGGGAAYNCNGTNCRFENNASTYQGGAVYYASGNTGNYTNCQFVGNTSGNHGGAAWYGTYVNCEFDGNTSTGTGNGGAGYGVKCYDCKIVNNKTLGHRGGGMAQSTCFDCVFSNNCCATGARGGASAWSNGTRCKFYGNGDVSVGCFVDCEFDGILGNANQPYVFDSLENGGGCTYITNCLIHNCEVAQIFHCDGRTMEAVNCTIVDNKLKKFGSYNALVAVCNLGVAYNPAGNHASTNRLINCLFANNTADGVRLDLSVWVTTAATAEGVPCMSELINCMYESGSSSTGGIVKENCFQGRARFNKGSYANQPYYALRYGSEARNKGKNFPWMDTGKDLAGKNRIIDGIVDIGCYECDMLPLGLILRFQ